MLSARDLEAAQAVAAGLRDAKAANTRRVYTSAWHEFNVWALANGRQSLPAEPQTVALYLGRLAADGRAMATIALARAAISHAHAAEVENAIRDLKYGVGLNHMPSGCFAANGAWLAVQVMAHNLARWTARIGLGEQIVTTKTLRRRVFALAGRLTLHLPQRWPWETQFTRALARLRAIPFPA